MPKRSLDASNAATTMPQEKTQRKTERSHEENQERAYIAASRRADRSIEARVKSAQMASEIHKKRTGKGFKISEKIVQAEEMYEEEEDDMPRSYRMLAAHLQTNSPELNYRVNAFLANRVAMASMVAGIRNEDWLQNPINKMFAEQFPNADRQAQAMSQRISTPSGYTPASGQAAQRPETNAEASPMSPSFGNVDYHHHSQFAASRSSSIAMSPTEVERTNVMSPVMSPHAPEQISYSRVPEEFGQPMPTDPLMYSDSAFTSELPAEAKMLAGPSLDMNDPMTTMFMGGDQMSSYYPEESLPNLKHESQFDGHRFSAPHDYYSSAQQANNDFSPFGGHDSTTGTPVPGGQSDNWDSYMDWSGCGETTTEFRG